MRRGLDHLVLCTHDIDRASTLYDALGFTLTPRAAHPWGTDNRLVQLDGCFLELLTVARPAGIVEPRAGQFSFGAFSRDFLENQPGLAMLVFETADAHADHAEFAARGLASYEPFHFERSARLPDGSEARVAFTLAFTTDNAMPSIAFFCCQQHAPELFWKPEFQHHKNGGRAVREVFLASQDPHSHHEFFERLAEPDSVSADGDALIVDTPRGVISVQTPETLSERFVGANFEVLAPEPSFAGFSVGIAHIGVAAAGLDRAAIPHHLDGHHRLWIDAPAGEGAIIELIEGG